LNVSINRNLLFGENDLPRPGDFLTPMRRALCLVVFRFAS
jgi:hypothetical protein